MIHAGFRLLLRARHSWPSLHQLACVARGVSPAGSALVPFHTAGDVSPAVADAWAPWLGTRIRRLIWLWHPWAAVAIWALTVDRFCTAGWTGTVAFVAYLLRWPEVTPTLGLDHTSPVGSRPFLDTAAGLTGVDFEPGNTMDVLENGDEFYPRCSKPSSRHRPR